MRCCARLTPTGAHPCETESMTDSEVTACDARNTTERSTDADETTVELVLVCGAPGVGKTTVAKRIADCVDGQMLRTDVIRKELFTEPAYTEAETKAVYGELIDRARRQLNGGKSVVLDATFADERFRTAAQTIGDEAASEVTLVKVECDEAVIERRIERRNGISDADFADHRRIKRAFDRIEATHTIIDNSGDVATTMAQIDERFG